ncbi:MULTISPECIES: helix-hairpin-helix domain-containing protein [unclassified Frondihabitans]|uniref:helix-hairpin-helix domain-containing protein n=1 Tax=unclassified Frondihabitans TaxID=2626248 RepID=UPI000F4D425D|nr:MULTISPECIES: helix-hairpin-helix domain-containing protein [unclassified Frondihabitans]RPE75301.1 competence protein ComEA [Frondihabitans sp. PhB153]RPF04543.1 competence protein ComEA [Frondihabitans sp. PhB161]
MTTQLRTSEPRPPDFREPGSAPRWRIGVGAAVVAALVLFGVLVVVSALRSGGAAVSDVPLTSGSTPATSRPTASASASAGPTVFVHILGRVRKPGLYEVAGTARAVDVVAAAGGFQNDADQAALNLARTVTDGEQIVVPRVGESPPPLPPAGSDSSASDPGTAPVDLNAADEAALETLTGVGPATAAAIIAWRDEHGRFESVDDLLDVTGIGEKKLQKLRDGVVVR